MDHTDHKSALNALVGEAMKVVAQGEYLRLTQPEKQDNCNGEVQCLVSRHADLDKERAAAYSLAMTFNLYADYESAISRLVANREAMRHDKEGQINNLWNFATAHDAEAANDAVREIMQPFSVITRCDALNRLASAYAFLTLEWNKAQEFYSWLTPEKCMPDTIIGGHIVKAFAVMKSKGTFDQWNRLTRAVGATDEGLKILERNLLP